MRTRRIASIAGALGLLFVLVFAGVASATPLSGDPAPSIASDYADYGPGDLVTLTGSNWLPGETVHISVNDDQGATWSRDVDVTADGYGSVQDQFNLPNWFVASYSVKATDAAGSVATASFTDSVQGLASVDVNTSYRNTTGNQFSFTLKNTSTQGETIRSFRVSAPSNSYAITNCAPPAGWALDSQSNSNCTFESGSLAVGATASGFKVTASLSDGDNDTGNTMAWAIDKMSTSATYDNSGQAKASAASPGSMDAAAYVFELKDVVLATTNPTIDSACPASSRSAPAGSTRVVVVCGVNHRGTALTTAGANSTLGGSEFASTGTFNGGSVGANSSGSRVLAYWTGATIASTSTNNSATTRISTAATQGGSFTQTSPAPSTAFNGYDATNPISTTSTSISRQAGTNPSTYGESLTFRATVSGNNGNPNGVGTVTFKDGSTVLCNAVALSGNTADCTPSLAAGSHNVTAEYSGATGFTASTSAALGQTVNQRPITVTADAQTKIYGDADPNLTYQLTGGTLVAGDSITGSLSRAAGETVAGSPYAITQGTVTAGPNYNMTFVGASFTITRKNLTIANAKAADKTYDGDNSGGVDYTQATLTGKLAADTVTIDASASTATFDTKNVGTDITVTVTGVKLAGAAASNYTVSQPSGLTAAITARPITVTADAQSKTYGDADPALTYKITSGSLVQGESLTGALTRDGGNTVAGSPYAIRQGTLSASANYGLTYVGANLTITPKGLTITGAKANNKVYDGTTIASLDFTNASLQGVVGNDQVTIDSSNYSASFDTKSAGTNKPVTVSGVGLGGSAASNYTVAQPSGLTAAITARPITVTADARSKTYGDADPSLTYQLTSGALVPGESLSGSLTRDAGETVAGSPYAIRQGTLSAGSNYDLTYVGANLAITAKGLTITGAKANDKVYDGDNSASVDFTNASLQGVVGNDTVTIDKTGYSASFDTKNVGTNRPVTVSGVGLGGSAASNYTVSQPSGLTAAITARPITVTADDQSKTYGQADPSLTYKVTSGTLVAGDGITGSLGRDSGETVGGSPYAIRQGNLSAGSNYDLTFVAGKLTITPKGLTISGAKANDKVYDANTNATVDFSGASLPGVVGNDTVTIDKTGYTATFDTKNIGTNKPVTVTGVKLGGNDAGNYTVSQPSGLTAAITAKGLTISGANANDKVYNGDRSATVDFSNATLDGVVGNETVSIDSSGYSASFDSKDVGANKPVTVTGVTLGSPAASNYTVAQPSGLTAAITARPITVTADAKSKTYGDADPNLTYKVTSGSLASGDSFSGALTRAPGETVAGSPYAIGRGTLSAGSNYDLTFGGANLTITAKTVTGSFTAADKTVDGTTAATIVKRTLAGVVGTDDVRLDGGTATFDTPSVGQNKTVTGTGFTLAGAAAGNYALASSTLTTTASILYAPATASCLGSPGHTILQPINADGTSVFKQGSTVPAKFRVCDASGNSIGTAGVVASFAKVQVISGTESQAVNETVDSTTPDTAFRWSATDQQWIFNISTKSLTANKTYVYQVTLNDGTSFTFRFGLK